jgi:hypothetical protein
MSEKQDPHLNILLSRETGEQSKLLTALNDKVAIANGRTSKIEKKVEDHQAILDNWKGRLAVIVIVSGFVLNLIITFAKHYFSI